MVFQSIRICGCFFIAKMIGNVGIQIDDFLINVYTESKFFTTNNRKEIRT